jgi:hypothetical protein
MKETARQLHFKLNEREAQYLKYVEELTGCKPSEIYPESLYILATLIEVTLRGGGLKELGNEGETIHYDFGSMKTVRGAMIKSRNTSQLERH